MHKLQTSWAHHAAREIIPSLSKDCLISWLMKGMFARERYRYQQQLRECAVLEKLKKREGAPYIILYI